MENAAFNPIIFSERGKVGQNFRLLLVESQRTKFFPFAPIGKFGNEFGFFNGVEKMIHAAFQKRNIVRIKFQTQNIIGKIGNLPANINDAADHADARTFARHR